MLLLILGSQSEVATEICQILENISHITARKLNTVVFFHKLMLLFVRNAIIPFLLF